MADESCIHCGQPSEDGDRVTESGRVHERCWDAFSEEKPVAKSSVVAGCFGLSMVAGGATLLSIGLAVLAMVASLDSANIQNPLVGIPAAIMWIIGMGVVFLAIPAGAIMLLIAFFTWVVTNNNALKNYLALGLVAIVVVILGFSIDFRGVFDNLVSRFDVVPKEPDFETECKSRSSSISLGTYYRDVVPCRGVATEFYADGQKKSEISYADPSIELPGNGRIGKTCFPKEIKRRNQLSACEVRDGMATYWYPNGQKKEEELFKDGYGLSFIRWHENGQMRARLTFSPNPEGNWPYLREDWCEDGRKKIDNFCAMPSQ
jgi:hypothetical protein